MAELLVVFKNVPQKFVDEANRVLNQKFDTTMQSTIHLNAESELTEEKAGIVSVMLECWSIWITGEFMRKYNMDPDTCNEEFQKAMRR